MLRTLPIWGCLALTNCVVPRALELEGDAGTSGRPRIERHNADPPLGPLTMKVDERSKGFFLWIRDPDSLEIDINVFLDGDYTAVLPVSKKKHKFTDTKVSNGINFEILWLCRDLVKTTDDTKILQLYVSDGGFMTTGDLRKPTQENGHTDDVMWKLTCIEPISNDGGN